MEAFIRLIMLTEKGMPYAEIELPKIDAVKDIKKYKFVVFNEANEEHRNDCPLYVEDKGGNDGEDEAGNKVIEAIPADLVE